MQQRHATDVVSLVFGIIFAGFTLVWALEESDQVTDGHAWWAGPLVLIVAGAAGLLASLRSTRSASAAVPAERLGDRSDQPTG